MNDFYRFRHSVRLSVSRPAEAIIDSAPFTRFELCLGIALLYPMERQQLRELIPQESEEWNAVSLAIASLSPEDDGNALLSSLDCSEEMKNRLLALSLYCEENFVAWSRQVASRNLKKLCQSANKDVILRKQATLIEALKKAKQDGDTEDEKRILSQYQQVIKLSRMATSQHAS